MCAVGLTSPGRFLARSILHCTKHYRPASFRPGWANNSQNCAPLSMDLLRPLLSLLAVPLDVTAYLLERVHAYPLALVLSFLLACTPPSLIAHGARALFVPTHSPRWVYAVPVASYSLSRGCCLARWPVRLSQRCIGSSGTRRCCGWSRVVCGLYVVASSL